jgi:hypothetical protein
MKRMTYEVLKRWSALDDAYLEDLKTENSMVPLRAIVLDLRDGGGRMTYKHMLGSENSASMTNMAPWRDMD